MSLLLLSSFDTPSTTTTRPALPVTRIFGLDIARIVSQAIPPSAVPSMVLRQWTAGTRTTGHVAAGTQPTSQDYACRGIFDSYVRRPMMDADQVQVGDKKFLIIAQPLNDAGVIPEVDDEIVDAQGASYRVVYVPERDPASATYEVFARG
jgi:hypothetical protein